MMFQHCKQYIYSIWSRENFKDHYSIKKWILFLGADRRSLSTIFYILDINDVSEEASTLNNSWIPTQKLKERDKINNGDIEKCTYRQFLDDIKSLAYIWRCHLSIPFNMEKAVKPSTKINYTLQETQGSQPTLPKETNKQLFGTPGRA